MLIYATITRLCKLFQCDCCQMSTVAPGYKLLICKSNGRGNWKGVQRSDLTTCHSFALQLLLTVCATGLVCCQIRYISKILYTYGNPYLQRYARKCRKSCCPCLLVFGTQASLLHVGTLSRQSCRALWCLAGLEAGECSIYIAARDPISD